jgi:hypothetical protein
MEAPDCAKSFAELSDNIMTRASTLNVPVVNDEENRFLITVFIKLLFSK